MSKRSARPAGAPWLSPYLIVKDADAALDFYQRAFGFEKRMAMPGPDGRTRHAEVGWKDALIMFSPEPEAGSECTGKTTLARQLAEDLPETHLRQINRAEAFELPPRRRVDRPGPEERVPPAGRKASPAA